MKRGQTRTTPMAVQRSFFAGTVLLVIALFLLAVPAAGAENATAATPVECPVLEPCAEGTTCIYYFYGDGCPHCARIRPVIDALAEKYPEVELRAYEIYFNTTNRAMLNDFRQRYNVTKAVIPTLFVGDQALIGETAIRTGLEERITWYRSNPRVCPVNYTVFGGDPLDVSPAQPVNLTVPAIVAAAAIDSINPCAIAVLVILLAYLASLGERRRVAVVGCAYIATVFVVYFIAGLGLLSVVQKAGLTGPVFTIAAIIAIITGLINIAEVLLKREIFTLAIPASQKGTIDRYIRKASVPSAIVLGALVSMVELPCTGGIYLAILGLLANRMTLAEGIPYLLLYNLVFVLPLVLILIVMVWGGTPQRLEKFRTGSRRWVRLVMGIVMVALGAAMLAGII
ncbi:MAG TPA: cytochrome c biogenesis protein CcdA [Methanoregulaceae archaeon]|nr:cytochrome c biogenesis protein CcdA [Methanoregulaceae archaeon]HRY76441.1 cytochrome c biogenesis protein CcdA [Methanoregulaceae archaeon]